MNRQEALSEIRQTAEQILKESQEPVTRVRLLRDILHRPDDAPELVEARRLSADTKLGKRLEEELQAGAFMKALNTATDLGLPENHPAFTEVKNYADNWRGKRGAHDWTTRVLLLLQKYYENEEL